MLMANTETKAARAAKTGADATDKTMKSAADLRDAAFDYAKFPMPEMFRSFAEQGLSQSREAYARMKAAAEEATDLIEESLETTREGMREVQFKTLDAAKANADAGFDLVRRLLSVTSVADVVQIQTAFARERFEAFVDYSKDVQTTLSKVSTEATKPAKTLFDKALNTAQAA
jgi:phasin